MHAAHLPLVKLFQNQYNYLGVVTLTQLICKFPNFTNSQQITNAHPLDNKAAFF